MEKETFASLEQSSWAMFSTVLLLLRARGRQEKGAFMVRAQELILKSVVVAFEYVSCAHNLSELGF